MKSGHTHSFNSDISQVGFEGARKSGCFKAVLNINAWPHSLSTLLLLNKYVFWMNNVFCKEIFYTSRKKEAILFSFFNYPEKGHLNLLFTDSVAWKALFEDEFYSKNFLSRDAAFSLNSRLTRGNKAGGLPETFLYFMFCRKSKFSWSLFF